MLSAKYTKPEGVSSGVWDGLWVRFPIAMNEIYDISQELPGFIDSRYLRITTIIERILSKNLRKGSAGHQALLIWRSYLLNDTFPPEFAPHKLVKFFYKKIRGLISAYEKMGQAAIEDEEGLLSRYYGIATGLRQIENYMSNHEPWNVYHIILAIVTEQHRINYEQSANKENPRFNLIFSKGEEEALMIIRGELIPPFLPMRPIVVCR